MGFFGGKEPDNPDQSAARRARACFLGTRPGGVRAGWKVEVALTALASLRPEKSGTTRGKGQGHRLTQLGGVEWGNRDESKIAAQWEVRRKQDVKYAGVVVSEWREGAQPEGKDRGQYLALIREADSKLKLKKRGCLCEET